MPPSFEHENVLITQHGPNVAGVDEAGRGPWAGPVVAGAVVIYSQADFRKQFGVVNDSKKLSHTAREALFETMAQSSILAYGIGQASVEEIDQLNILQATFLAMQRAVENLEMQSCLIDGNHSPVLPVPTYPLIKGDSLSYSVAAASIFAKVTRDRLMRALAQEYPAYGWERNAGYGTKQHSEAIAQFGITPHHRRSYAPIRKILEAAV